MENIKVNEVIDAKGLSCPMPIVKAKRAIDKLAEGQVVELLATDKGSKNDIKAWAETTGNQYLGTLEQDGVYKHYLRKSSSEDTVEKKHEITATNEELSEKLMDSDTLVIDVREAAEYTFGHIPGAISVPLGDLEDSMANLPMDKKLYVVCRTGHRSDLAAQKLAAKGFKEVVNVLPGMNQWNGAIEGLNQ